METDESFAFLATAVAESATGSGGFAVGRGRCQQSLISSGKGEASRVKKFVFFFARAVKSLRDYRRTSAPCWRCWMNSSTVLRRPSSSEMREVQPRDAKRLTSSSLRGVPSGLLASHSMRPP